MEKKESEEVVQMCFLSELQNGKMKIIVICKDKNDGPSVEEGPFIMGLHWRHLLGRSSTASEKSYVQTGMPINIRIYSYRLFKGWVLHPIPESQEVKIKKSIKKVALSRSSQEQQESLTKEVG